MNGKKLHISCMIACFLALFLFMPLHTQAAQGKWKVDNDRWWYQYENGSCPAKQWMEESGSWYYFDEDGWLVTGWKQIDGNWYYLQDNGSMAAGWNYLGGKWYYMDPSGAMVTGWRVLGNKWYYFDASGAMTMDWQYLGGKWYYMDPSGAMVTGWCTLGNQWYYFDGTGAMTMDWQYLGGKWYYLGASGSMETGWKLLGGKWYYFTASGAMAVSSWIGNCYVDENGVWDPSEKKTNGHLVAIDPGHQRHGNPQKEPIGPGASQMKAKVASGTSGKWSGLAEYQLTLTVSLKLRDELVKRGYQVYMIRETHDVDISNAQRAKMAADAGADSFIRIHANGDDNPSVNGVLTMAPSSSNPYLKKDVASASQNLSRYIVNHLSAVTGARNRGVMTTDTMSGINWCTVPVSIVEMGFMTNENEDRLMATDAYQNKMVRGIADGIDQYYASK